MKQPKMSDLVLDTESTKRIRSKMAKQGKVKITINIDKDSLAILRLRSGETGIPYQRLLNRILKEALQKKQTTETRLDHLERELAKLKRKRVA
jgi:predicted DNA binding CopG/RHH family protein